MVITEQDWAFALIYLCRLNNQIVKTANIRTANTVDNLLYWIINNQVYISTKIIFVISDFVIKCSHGDIKSLFLRCIFRLWVQNKVILTLHHLRNQISFKYELILTDDRWGFYPSKKQVNSSVKKKNFRYEIKRQK